MAEVAVLGAVGYAGAIAAQLLYRHPFFELGPVTARAEAGQRLDDVHPRTRVPHQLEVFDVAGTPSTRRRRLSARRGGAGRGRAAGRGHARRRSLGRLPAARPGDLRGLVRRAQGAVVLRAGRLRAAGADARGDSRRGSRGQPRLLSDGGAARAGAAGARGRDRRRRDRRQVRRLRRGARADALHALHLAPTRTSRRTRSPGTGTRPRSSRSWACWARRCRSRSCRTCCRWTRASSCPAT